MSFSFEVERDGRCVVTYTDGPAVMQYGSFATLAEAVTDLTQYVTALRDEQTRLQAILRTNESEVQDVRSCLRSMYALAQLEAGAPAVSKLDTSAPAALAAPPEAQGEEEPEASWISFAHSRPSYPLGRAQDERKVHGLTPRDPCKCPDTYTVDPDCPRHGRLPA